MKKDIKYNLKSWVNTAIWMPFGISNNVGPKFMFYVWWSYKRCNRFTPKEQKNAIYFAELTYKNNRQTFHFIRWEGSKTLVLHNKDIFYTNSNREMIFNNKYCTEFNVVSFRENKMSDVILQCPGSVLYWNNVKLQKGSELESLKMGLSWKWTAIAASKILVFFFFSRKQQSVEVLWTHICVLR